MKLHPKDLCKCRHYRHYHNLGQDCLHQSIREAADSVHIRIKNCECDIFELAEAYDTIKSGGEVL